MKRTCFICGKITETRTVSIPYLNEKGKSMEYLYFECCGYYRQKQFLKDSEMDKLYRKDYEDFKLPGFMTFIKNFVTVSKAGKLKRYIAGKSVLEVGSSTGGFVNEAKKRNPLKIHGIEISQDAARIAKKRYGIDLDVTSFEDYKTRGKFDSIFMFHVIEHFRDPLYAAEKAYGLLNKGGSIILETPSFDSWEQYAFKENWYGWQVPFHTYLFSSKSLSKLLKKAGFRIRQTDHSNVPNSWVGSLKKRLPKTRSLGILLLPLYGLFYIPAYLAAKSKKGGRIIMHAYKK